MNHNSSHPVLEKDKCTIRLHSLSHTNTAKSCANANQQNVDI